MRISRTGAKVLTAAVGLSLFAAACGGSDEPGSGGKKDDTNVGLKSGGTLKLIGTRDLTNYDTNQAYEVRAWGFTHRALTRQLVTYPNVADKEKADTVVPDIAEDLPQVSDDGLTYTFKLKRGVKFSPPYNSEIVAGDFVRGIKRLCDPNGVSGGLSYFTSTIKGMTAYCATLSKIKTGSAGLSALKSAIESAVVPGLTAKDDQTLVITLDKPASDFVNMLATPFSSPVPAGVLAYITDSPQFRANFPASGPYMIDKYRAKQYLYLKRNPNWDPKTDNVRKAYVDRIEFTANAASKEAQQQQVEAGTMDAYWRGNPPTVASAKYSKLNDPRLHVEQTDCGFYISFNMHNPSGDGKLLGTNKALRQAINYAVDKQAILRVLGGKIAGTPYGQILTPPILGYEKYDPYATPDSKGDIAKAKTLMSQAGISKNLKLTYLFDDLPINRQLFSVLADNLKQIGITLNPKGVEDSTAFSTKPNSPAWDLYYAGWCPDWPGNNARTFFTPLLSDPGLKNYNAGGSYNYGGYDNPAVDALVQKALTTPKAEDAKAVWSQVDKATTDDAPWVPLYVSTSVNFVNGRVKGYTYFPFSTSFDLTNVSVL